MEAVKEQDKKLEQQQEEINKLMNSLLTIQGRYFP